MPPRGSKEKRAKGAPPAPDVYVALLAVGLAAMTFAIVLLAMELNNYGGQLPT